MTGPIELALQNACSARSATPQSPHSDHPSLHDAPLQLPLTAISTAQQTKRTIHVVSTISQRRTVIRWMLEEQNRSGIKALFAKALRQFPNIFVQDYKSNHIKVSRWWSKRYTLMDLGGRRDRRGNMTGVTAYGGRQVKFKAALGRGRKRKPWVLALHAELIDEYYRMKAVRMKLSVSVLRIIAMSLVSEAPPESLNHPVIIAAVKPLKDVITIRFIQCFMDARNLVIRQQTGKKQVSSEKQLFIEKSIAYHLVQLKRNFESGLLKEDLIENADETLFVINMDNGRTIGERGDKTVKYADVVSGDEAITMMVHITGGKNARVNIPMLIFKNDRGSYPIRGVPDNVPGVCYRSQRKAWMDGKRFEQWLSERRIHTNVGDRRQRTLFVDNCPGHNMTDGVEESLVAINKVLRKFPANATDLVQPADSFIISKIKDAWRRGWDAHKAMLIRSNQWVKSGEGCSGKLVNPGKHFFLRLAADAVREVNTQVDRNKMGYARKAMIKTGMSLTERGTWEETQLFNELQAIIANHRSHFEGEPISTQ